MRGGGLWSAVEGRRKAPCNSGRDRRCGKADGLRGLSRDGSLAGTKVHCSRRSLALPHRRWVYLRDDLRIPDTGGYTQRQQPGRLCPGRPEHFWRGLPRQRCGGIAARYNTAKPYLGVETAKASWPARGTAGFCWRNDPARERRQGSCPRERSGRGQLLCPKRECVEVAGYSRSTDLPSGIPPSHQYSANA